MINRALFTSQKQDWNTPKDLFDELNKEFNFDCDPCLIPSDTIHPKDMLGSDWGKSNFVNPPYNQIIQWLMTGYEKYKKGATVVFLLPSRTDTSWWHDYALKATEIRFIRGRLTFSNYKHKAPFPSVIIIFKGK